MGKRILMLIATFGVAITAASFNFGGNKASATVPGTNAMLNVTPTGSMGNTPISSVGKISANGRYAAFSTSASNIVTGDTNGSNDAFVRDLSTNTTIRVDISTTGIQANTGGGANGISETGRYVLISSKSSNLIDGTTEPTTYSQLYLRDTVANTTTLISQTSAGTLANGDTGGVTISADGRFVLLVSSATNLGPTPTNGQSNLYILDRNTQSFTALNVKTDGTFVTSATPIDADMSCDGSLVVFQYGALFSGETHNDVYLVDRRAGSTLTALTTLTNGAAFYPSISCSGDYISLASDGTNLDTSVSGLASNQCRVYSYDRINATYSLADQSSSGTIGNTSAGTCTTTHPLRSSISDTGVLAFRSFSTNITSPSTTGSTQLFVRSVKTGVTELLSRDSSGAQDNGTNSFDSINPSVDKINGKIVEYLTYATNLTSPAGPTGDPNTITSLTGY